MMKKSVNASIYNSELDSEQTNHIMDDRTWAII
jgi:hypothetical protein